MSQKILTSLACVDGLHEQYTIFLGDRRKISLIVFLFSMKSYGGHPYGGTYCDISDGDSVESIYPKNTIVEEHTYYLKKEEHWLRDRCEGELLENSGRPQWGVQKCPQGLFPSFQNDVKFHENDKKYTVFFTSGLLYYRL